MCFNRVNDIQKHYESLTVRTNNGTSPTYSLDIACAHSYSRERGGNRSSTVMVACVFLICLNCRRYFVVYLALCENVNDYCRQTHVDSVGLCFASTAGNVLVFRRAIRE